MKAPQSMHEFIQHLQTHANTYASSRGFTREEKIGVLSGLLSEEILAIGVVVPDIARKLADHHSHTLDLLLRSLVGAEPNLTLIDGGDTGA